VGALTRRARPRPARPRPARVRRAPRLVAGALLALGGSLLFSAAAYAASPSLLVTPSAGLAGGKSVSVFGSGLAANVPGYILECNDTPEPTIGIGPPFDMRVSVGCSAPSLKRIARTTAAGTLAVKFIVHEGRKVGPPCGLPPIIGGCGGLDSADKHPRKDAQNYPCPPSPAQQAAGYTCYLEWIDTAGDHPETNIRFLGPGTATTTTTTSPVTATTVPGGGGSTTTTPGGGGGGGKGGTTTTVAVTRSTSGGGGSGGSTSGSGGSSPSTAHAVTAPSGSLAFTGLGRYGILLAIAGGVLVLLGALLFAVDVRRFVSWLLGL